MRLRRVRFASRSGAAILRFSPMEETARTGAGALSAARGTAARDTAARGTAAEMNLVTAIKQADPNEATAEKSDFGWAGEGRVDTTSRTGVGKTRVAKGTGTPSAAAITFA